MCLIVFAYDCHPGYRLILGANRDEFRDRPADPAGFWSSAPHVLAGIDRKGGGTWMGITTGGKLAAITNYRDSSKQVTDPPSRGKLVSSYLLDPSSTPEEYQGVLCHDGHLYDGFNLLYGTMEKLYYFTNRGGSSGMIRPGIHGLSNHLLDTSWAKVSVAKSRLGAIVEQGTVDPEQIFSAMYDPVPFADNLLPDTGVGLDRERILSPLFIENEVYGTRSSTVILVDRNGGMRFLERTFDHTAKAPSIRSFRFRIQSANP